MQLIVANEIVGQRCKSCARVLRLKQFPKASRRMGRGVFCSDCIKKEVAARNFQLNRQAVARRKLQGGTAPLRGDS